MFGGEQINTYSSVWSNIPLNAASGDLRRRRWIFCHNIIVRNHIFRPNETIGTKEHLRKYTLSSALGTYLHENIIPII